MKSLFYYLLLASVCVFLSACKGANEGKQKDLQQFIEELKATPPTTLSSVQPIKPANEKYLFDFSKRQSLFSPTDVHQVLLGKAPETRSVKEPLEQFSLTSLRFVGVVLSQGKHWALIQAPDKVVYYVKPGSYLGTDYGKVLSVTDTQVVLMETIVVNGAWVERKVVLDLPSNPT